MPLPVSHGLAGCAIYAATDADGGSGAPKRLLLAVILANAPDLDLLAGMAVGDPNRFHRSGSHSLVIAAVVAVAIGWLAWRGLRKRWPLRPGLPGAATGTALVVFLLLASHVLLDALTHDPNPPHGEQVLWPVSDAWLSLPPLFLRADKLDGPASPASFALSLFSWHNVRAMALEAAIVGPLALVAFWRRRRSTRRRSPPPAA